MNSNSKRLIVIACGGTGGHLTPGIALANALRAAGADALLLVSAKAIDKTLLEKYPELDARPAPGSGFVNPLRNPLGFVKFCAGALGGFLLGRRLLRERRPVAFVSFGGFLTTGPALAFRMARLPVVLHEANRVPGKAVRLLSKIATQVWLPPDVEMRGLRAGVARYAGFPLRPEIKAMDKAAARRALGFPEDGPLLLVTGGSQGAATLNNWTLANAAALAAAGVHLLCVTGPKNNVETPSLQTPPAPPAAPPAASAPVHRFIPFCSQMPEALSAAILRLLADTAARDAIRETLRASLGNRSPAPSSPSPLKKCKVKHSKNEK
jgi:UDP-N-acetylglucosamine--N-acetylmuramyl-(pentapeptide) pyrophosphoryl-undecaprenol N-acetylglucosamine transferase